MQSQQCDPKTLPLQPGPATVAITQMAASHRERVLLHLVVPNHQTDHNRLFLPQPIKRSVRRAHIQQMFRISQ